jgi:hypothetical protein
MKLIKGSVVKMCQKWNLKDFETDDKSIYSVSEVELENDIKCRVELKRPNAIVWIDKIPFMEFFEPYNEMKIKERKSLKKVNDILENGTPMIFEKFEIIKSNKKRKRFNFFHKKDKNDNKYIYTFRLDVHPFIEIEKLFYYHLTTNSELGVQLVEGNWYFLSYTFVSSSLDNQDIHHIEIKDLILM